MTTIALTTSHPELTHKAQLLAQHLKLPFTIDEKHYDYTLILTPDFLGLKKTNSSFLPLHIDFLSPEITLRRRQASLRKEALARALGLKSNTHPTIIDATAGLGRDSFILAALGFNVQLIERSPIVHALLQDGLTRALADPQTTDIASRMQLIHADATHWIQQSAPPELIYLDPMFPERRHSALAKKSMQFFQDIIGDDLDAETLLHTSLACATQRVVVKRPRKAAPLANKTPSFNLIGSSSRFDVYLK